LADIDEFTAYNAEFGEDAGDACLKSVAEALRLVVRRPADVLGRYAGGKFAILLPETDANAARSVAQRAMQAVEALELQHAALSAARRITLCVGGGCRDFARSTIRKFGAGSGVQTSFAQGVPEGLIETAEQALRSAKAAAEHRAIIFDMPDTEIPATSLT